MSYINFINDETITIMHGIGGIRLCEEAWIKKKDENMSFVPSLENSSKKNITQEYSIR